MINVIGRSSETRELQQLWDINEAVFVALYGRRRVGKTHLVRQCFQAKKFYLEITGIKNGSMATQLNTFIEAVSECFFTGVPLQSPKDWKAAFQFLTEQIKKTPEKVVIFFDELPWLATKRAGLMQVLDYFWNRFWSQMPNVKVIVCGSAASWMLNNLINAKGGLHNRLTKVIHLKPFLLRDTQQFLNHMGVKLSLHNIINLYMVTGGVPYYLKQIEKSKSVTQNIDKLCFTENGLLIEEFPRLFKALFDEAETNLTLIKEIAKHHYGLSRDELIQKANISSGGSLNKRLAELEAAGFIKSFIPYGFKAKNSYFKVVDEYSLFYLRWIEPVISSGKAFTQAYWPSQVNTPTWYSWAGYAFENVCLKHIEQIRQAIDLGKIGCITASWRFTAPKGSKKNGAQIDLLFDRDDNAITLCEIKFANKEYTIDKAYAKNLANKIITFEQQTKTKKQVFLAMITPDGIKPNLWSEDLVHYSVVIEDLFQ